MGIVDLNGYPMGVTGVATPGTIQPMNVLKFSKRFGGMLPSPVWATAIGDNNRNIHEYAFNANQMPGVAFGLHAFDMNAYAGFLQLKKFTDNNGYGVLLASNAPVNAAQACIVVNIDAKIADNASSFGEKRYINEIWPLVTVVPKLGNAQEVAPTEWEMEGRPSQAGKLPWGIPFTVATHGATRAGGEILTSDYPLVIETFTAAATETTATLTYTPALPTATYAKAWKDSGGTVTALTISVTGKIATFSALTAGDIVIFRYEATDLLTNN